MRLSTRTNDGVVSARPPRSVGGAVLATAILLGGGLAPLITPGPAAAAGDVVAPSVTTPILDQSSITQAETVTVTATATDESGVASAEVRIGDGPWLPMSFTDGTSGGASEGLSATVEGATVAQVATGYRHTCALLANGTVRCWGANSYGQLGDGSTTDSTAGVTVRGVDGVGALSGVTAISAGFEHTCAVLATGGVRCWGANGSGQLGDGTVPVSLSYRGPQLCDNVACSRTPVVVASVAGGGPLTGVTAISAGWWHTCAVITDRTARCWGYNANGELGNGAWLPSSNPVVVASLSGVTAISAAYLHTCAVLAEGAARCWGYNSTGQLGNDSTSSSSVPVTVLDISTATAINAAGNHTCALLGDTTVRCWGLNYQGSLGNGTFYSSSLTPVVVVGTAGTGILTGVTGIGGATSHHCARLQDGTLACWGSNDYGQLGIGSLTSRSAPTAVTDVAGTGTLANVTGMDGSIHSCAVVAGGAVCWGFNDRGQLGSATSICGTYPCSTTPLPVPGISGAFVPGTSPQVCVRATDASGNTSSGMACTTLVVRGPVVSALAPTTASPMNGTTIDYTLTFAESVTDLTAGDFTTGGTSTGWTVGSISGSGTGPYTVSLTAGSLTDGTVILTLLAGSVADAAGRGPATDAVAAAVTVDRTVPSVASFAPTTVSPTDGTTIGYSLTFAESVTNLTTGDFTIGGTSTGWTMGAISGSGAGPYTFTLGAGSLTDGTVVLTLGANSVTDGTGNAGPASSTSATAVTIDRTAPGVASFAPTTASPTNGTTIAYDLTFTESVTDLTTSDFTIGGTSTGWTVDEVSGSGASYAVVLGATSPTDGTVILTLGAASVTDGTGNIGPASSMVAAAVAIDLTSPAVVSFAPITPSPTNGTAIAYSLTFSEGVTSLSSGDFTVSGTSTGWSVGAIGGSGAGPYTFSLTAANPPSGTVSLTLAAGTVLDAAGSTGPSAAVAAATVMVDRTAPTVSSFAPTTASPTNGTTIAYSLTFSESVTGLTAADFSTGGTSSGWSVGAISGSGSGPYTFTVSAGSPIDGTVTLTLRTNSVSDGTGNLGPTSSAAAVSVTVDRTAPTVSSFAVTSANPTYRSPIVYALTFSESVTGLTAADFTSGGTSTGWTVDDVSGSGSSYTVTLGATGPTDGTVVLTLRSGSVADGAGNAGPVTPRAAAAVAIDHSIHGDFEVTPGIVIASGTDGTSTLIVSGMQGTIADVDLTLAIPVLYTSLLTVELKSPDGTTFTMFNQRECWLDNIGLTGLVLDDEAAYPLDWFSGSYDQCGGSWRPEQPLSGFDGKDPNGTWTLRVADTDQWGDYGPATIQAWSLGITIDRPVAPPTPTVALQPASDTGAIGDGRTSAMTLVFDVTFGTTVTGLSASDFTVGGTALGCKPAKLAGLGSAFTVTVSGCGEGTVTLSLMAGSVTGVSGAMGPATATTGPTVTIDRIAPAVSSFVQAGSSAGTWRFTLTFSESVAGLTASDFSLSGKVRGCMLLDAGITPNLASTVFTVQVTGCLAGSLTLKLLSGAVTDVAGNRGPVKAISVTT